MKNVFRFLLGIMLLLAGAFLFVACFSYHSADSSLNTSSTDTVQNLMGPKGAIAADLLLQIFGIMAFLIPIAVCVFGFFLLRKRKWLFLRFMMFICALLTACWLTGETVITGDIWTKVGAGGFLGFYLTRWFSSDLGVWRVLAWFLVGVFLVFSLRVPFFLICRWGSKKVCERSGIARFCSVLFSPVKVDSAHKQEFEQTPLEIQKVKLNLFGFKKKKEKVIKERKEPVFSNELMSESANEISEKGVKSEKTDGFFKKKNAFTLPTSDLLDPVKSNNTPALSKDAMARISHELEGVLAQFNIGGKVVAVHPGPVVTLYEFEPAPGIKTARIIVLADDVAMKMRCDVSSVRIAIIPGTNAIGIEMPNAKREVVYIREMVEHVKFQGNSGALPIVLGKDIGGMPVFADLAKMPHLLVAGTTGSGKSVAINTMILSLLYRFTPAECRLIMVDPKMVELSVYNRIPHLLTPVVVEPEKAVVALKWAVREMEDRYRSMSHLGVRNIEGYNQKLLQAAQEGRTLTRRVQTGFDPETGKPVFEEQNFDLTPIPYIVIIVDEMADLMGRCGKEVDPLIQRLAQMARAVGIHLILATQRPSVDVITGTIKSNFPSRMSFQVRSKIDSRTILDEQGAEQLLGKGDMLFMPAGQKPQRIHGPYVSDNDVENVVHFWEQQGEPQYLDAVTVDVENEGVASVGNNVGTYGANGGDTLYDQAVAIILRDKKVSTSYVQRQLRIGYNKAADLIDRMEAEGVISKPNISGKREILVPTDNA